MPFKAELSIQGKIFVIKRLFLLSGRQIDEKGRPITKPAWRIVLRIDAVSDAILTNWMIDPAKKMDGEITLTNVVSNVESRLKKIEFKNAQCYRMVDSFRSFTSYATCEIEIAGEELQIDSLMYVHSA